MENIIRLDGREAAKVETSFTGLLALGTWLRRHERLSDEARPCVDLRWERWAEAREIPAGHIRLDGGEAAKVETSFTDLVGLGVPLPPAPEAP